MPSPSIVEVETTGTTSIVEVIVQGPQGIAGDPLDAVNAPTSLPDDGGLWNDVGIVMAQGPHLAKDVALDTDAAATAGQNKLVLSSINHTTATYVRNTSCWITADVTCWPVWNSRYASETGSGCLITPRHMVFALHTGIQVGDTIRFLTNANVVITRTVSSLLTVSGDLQVGKLDSDLPSTITPASVMPASFTNYLTFGTDPPIISADQEYKLLVMDWASYSAPTATHATSVSATRLPLTEAIVSGDSGNPNFILIDGQLVLLGVHESANTFPLVSALITETNAALTTLGGGYQLTQVSLSAFTLLAIQDATGHKHSAQTKTIGGSSIWGTGDIPFPPGLPNSSVDNQLARFDGTAGNVQGSTVTLDDAGVAGTFSKIYTSTLNFSSPSSPGSYPMLTRIGSYLYLRRKDDTDYSNLLLGSLVASVSVAAPILYASAANAAAIPTQIYAFAGQTANLTEWYDSSNNVIASIAANGAFVATKTYLHPVGTYSPSGASPSQAVDLRLGNHQKILTASVTGTLALTLTCPAVPSAGTILIKTHATTPVAITWVAASGTKFWHGTEPSWATLAAGKWIAVSWISDGTDTHLFPSDISA